MDRIQQLGEHTPSKINHFGRQPERLKLPVEGAPYMDKINVAGLYYAGANMDPLLEIAEDATYASISFHLFGTRNAVKMLINHQIIPFPLTHGALERFQSVVVEACEKAEDPGSRQEVISSNHRFRLKIHGSQAKDALHAELENADTYFVAEVAGYHTQTLIEHGEKVLGETLASTLTKDIKTDFCEATKSLAFRSHTAVGFHILRAVEAVILEYLDVLKIARPSKPIERNMGNYIALLRKGKVDEKVLLPLDILRKEHRNELMHPDRILEKDESLVLFEVSKSALMMLLTDMNARVVAGTP
jgi:hypothetical protein